jgi:predicted ATPase
MAIRRLKVSNFRSFNELDIELGDFNVLIGANASGKSNFIEIFRFLRDIRNNGLRNAVAMQGGRSYVQNLQLGPSRALSIEFADDQDVGYGVMQEDEEEKAVFIQVNEMTYGFSLSASTENSRFHEESWDIHRDVVTRKFTAYQIDDDLESSTSRAGARLGGGSLTAERENGKLVPKFDIDSKIDEQFLENVTFLPIKPDWFSPEDLLLESRFFPLLLTGKPNPPFGTISDIGVYRIDAMASQQARQAKAPAELTEQATNLVPILDRLLSDESKRKTILNLVRFLLPFIEDIGVQAQIDESLLLYVTETFTDSTKLYAGLLSEGTIAAIALLVVLYFEDSPLVIFEDPDRGMHPRLMGRVVEMMKEVSKKKQVIITTHHPEIVRYAGVENLLFVSRDKDGYSQISRPADKTMVKRFLENDVGIDQLYVDNLLEV